MAPPHLPPGPSFKHSQLYTLDWHIQEAGRQNSGNSLLLETRAGAVAFGDWQPLPVQWPYEIQPTEPVDCRVRGPSVTSSIVLVCDGSTVASTCYPPGNWRELRMHVAWCHLVSRWARGGTTDPQTKCAQLFRPAQNPANP